MEIDIEELSFPKIWVDGKEDYWFSKAWEILKKQGMTSYSEEDKAGEQKVKLLAVSLGAMYLDFCKVAYGEIDYYDSLYENVTYNFFPEDEITYLCGAMGMYYPDSIKSSLFELEQKLRENILRALQAELSLSEICLGMYFSAWSTGKINNCLCSEDDADGNIDYETYESYWDLITHKTNLMISLAEFCDLMPAFQWLQERAYQIGQI